MKSQTGNFGKHKFTLLPELGWDDASIWFTWLGRFVIFERRTYNETTKRK